MLPVLLAGPLVLRLRRVLRGLLGLRGLRGRPAAPAGRAEQVEAAQRGLQTQVIVPERGLLPVGAPVVPEREQPVALDRQLDSPAPRNTLRRVRRRVSLRQEL